MKLEKVTMIAMSLIALKSQGHATTMKTMDESTTEIKNYEGNSKLKPNNKKELFDGFFVGVGAGYDFGRVKTSFNSTGVDRSVANNSGSLDGPHLGIFLGFGKVFKKFHNIYIGAEASTDFSNVSNPSTFSFIDVGGTQTINFNTKKTFSYALAGRVGKLINERTLLYLRGGFSSSYYKFHASSSLSNLNVQNNKTFSSFILGGGLEFAGGKWWKIGAEYNHAFERESRLTATNNSISFKPSSNILKLKFIIYPFNS
jgi:opacity protein-like surface antigen